MSVGEIPLLLFLLGTGKQDGIFMFLTFLLVHLLLLNLKGKLLQNVNLGIIHMTFPVFSNVSYSS